MTNAMKRAMAIKVVIFAVIAYLFPIFALIYLVMGLIDVSRHSRIDLSLLRGYFLGNGVLTWVLTPFNLLTDLISGRYPVVWRPEDFPEAHRKEIEDLLAGFRNNREMLIRELAQRMDGKKRGMVFFRWYDRPGDDSIPEFNRDWNYIKTIGISVFNSREATRLHYGPVRVTVRLLFNLDPKPSEEIFLEVDGKKHFWHEEPLIIFDDTINHRSVNGEDWPRYVAFVDVLRPSRLPALQAVLVAIVAAFQQVNSVFYTNWTQMRLRDA
jgi:aspartyl/asparaginyl beta-hydroxylase (cupin superfamily)